MIKNFLRAKHFCKSHAGFARIKKRLLNTIRNHYRTGCLWSVSGKFLSMPQKRRTYNLILESKRCEMRSICEQNKIVSVKSFMSVIVILCDCNDLNFEICGVDCQWRFLFLRV